MEIFVKGMSRYFTMVMVICLSRTDSLGDWPAFLGFVVLGACCGIGWNDD